jgi:hypothetical protein
MKTVAINMTGGTYRHPSLPLSAQATRNFWPQKQSTDKAKSTYILAPWPGKTLFGNASTGIDRGMVVHKGVPYKVTGTTLYSVASNGVHTTLGTVPGLERCIFAPIGDKIVIETAGLRYVWNGTTVSAIADIDLESGTGIAHLNNQILYGGQGGRFGVSDVGDPASINGLNYATAESEADNLIRPYTFNQVAYMMGERTIELWWNSGQGNPPFDRFEGGIVQVGLGAFHSVANDDEALYFLGDDYQIYTMRGGSSAVISPISTLPMAQAFKRYATVSDAIGLCMNLDGQWFYQITFPTESKTWVYVVGGEWFELSSGPDEKRDIANSYAFVYGKHLVSDYRNGNIYELSNDVFTENGDEIIRIRDSAYLHGGLFEMPGKEIEMSRFELIMHTGAGQLSGQGQDPLVMLSFSDDGGRTFSTEMVAPAGKIGDFIWRVEWFNLGRFESRIVRIRVSDPVYWSIYSAAADLEACL